MQPSGPVAAWSDSMVFSRPSFQNDNNQTDIVVVLIILSLLSTMLKDQRKEDLPPGVLSRDKKVNQAVYKQHFRREAADKRNRLDLLLHNFQPGFLEPEYEGDQTVKVKQQDIQEAVNIQTAANAFDLDLAMGDYRCHYARNGSSLMLTSTQGHLAVLDWREKSLSMEINLRENIYEGTFLHNDEMMALCQLSNTFIYDNRGLELHKLPFSLGVQYLPYHFLLALYDNKKLKYYDTTTGHIVADHIAKNSYTCMSQNKSNAVIAMGTSKGVVQWWTPGTGTPAVQLFVGSKIDDVAFYKGYMYTLSDKLKVWDSRMLKLVVQQPLSRRAKNLAVSDSGLLGINYGFKVQFLKDSYVEKQNIPYLRHNCSSKYATNNVEFVPFEDLVGLGHSKGFSSIIVPGSGVPIYDTYENNPFESKKQKREGLVHKLLQKLAPETITVDPNILGGMSRLTKEQLDAEEKAETEKKQREHLEKLLSKKKAKGRSKISKKLNKKEIEMDKLKRAEMTKVVNSRMWAKRAERKKREGEMSLIEQMQEEGLGVADLMKSRKAQNKEEESDDEEL